MSRVLGSGEETLGYWSAIAEVVKERKIFGMTSRQRKKIRKPGGEV